MRLDCDTPPPALQIPDYDTKVPEDIRAQNTEKVWCNSAFMDYAFVIANVKIADSFIYGAILIALAKLCSFVPGSSRRWLERLKALSTPLRRTRRSCEGHSRPLHCPLV